MLFRNLLLCALTAALATSTRAKTTDPKWIAAPLSKDLLHICANNQNIESNDLVDGLADTALTFSTPMTLRARLEQPNTVAGISLLFNAPETIDPATTIQIAIRPKDRRSGITAFRGLLFNGVPSIGTVDGRMSRSFYFDPSEIEEIGIMLNSEKTPTIELCEITLLQEQKIDSKPGRCEIILDPDKSLGKIDPRIFGANIEFWLDDDATLSDFLFTQRIKETGITVLRYPGGTESDRYLWKEHKLYDKAYWPFVDGSQTTDTDEMMAFAKKVGAEVILCVNTELAFFENDWDKAADYAAEWVTYCKDKGYNVKYWTIGNEMYWKFHFTAKEYAKIVHLYATKMKAADPSIKIAAAGETGINFIGKKDRVSGKGIQLLDELQDKRERLEIDHNIYLDQVNELYKLYPNKNPDPWWNCVFNEAADLIDGVEVHLYPADPKKAFMKERYAQELRNLKAYAEKRTGRSMSLAVTEWNINTQISGIGKESQGMEQGLYVGEFLGALIHGGTDISTYWPITMKGGWAKKAFYTLKEHDTLPSFYGFALAANNLTGNVVSCKSSHEGFYSIASNNPETGITKLLIYGRPQAEAEPFTEMDIDLSSTGFRQPECMHIELLYAREKRSLAIQRLEPAFEQTRKSVRFIMPRYAMAVITIKTRQR